MDEEKAALTAETQRALRNAEQRKAERRKAS
jgi:hypothetical protein